MKLYKIKNLKLIKMVYMQIVRYKKGTKIIEYKGKIITKKTK